ncbi:sarcoplasmic/endoplasmic reticulum calcium ATPase regulator DWORF [Pelodytes ibericus]
MREKTIEVPGGLAKYRRLLVPAILIAGWITGCAVMIYVVFSWWYNFESDVKTQYIIYEKEWAEFGQK